ncbi:MAG TPA: hypothetical protein VD996_02750 [Chitinophagaceae bacterium]|nr:hypothetical protein [Chitinophagaceae bacterium]
MKLKVAFILTLLVLGSLLSFSNKCGTVCDGPAVFMSAPAEASVADEEEKAESSSPLLRIATVI